MSQAQQRVLLFSLGFVASTLLGSLFHNSHLDNMCERVANGQPIKRDGTECYVVHENGALVPVRWKP